MDLEEFSETEIGEALDWLESSEDDGAAIHLYSRRPNYHGGHLSKPLQPLSNRYQKFIRHLRPSSLEDIDPRTRMVLFKMLNLGIFDDINGCISTGKEANVYHATKDDGQEFAVKVYKTSVPRFKDGDPYIQGDYCFRRGYLKHNPRQMPKTWAENEMRNLMRLKAAGIRCPTPIFLRLHVLSLRGNLSSIHSDYLHVIDVSQSVDLDHPLASCFLRLDCKHDFFGKNGVKFLSTRELFDFIVDSSITDESVHCYLEEVQREILVWRDAMSRLISVESDILWGQDTVGLLYISPAPKQLLKQPKKSDTSDTSTGQTNNFGTECGTDEDDSSDSEGLEPVIPADKKAARKENKKKVKEEKREARKSKTRKAVRKTKKKPSKNIKAR
ncbi:hypothetical protein MKW98_012892 [Papaver atlanticum]|uniref:Serine/threonine-protein kinase RIO1 n=1 Tax=Papaver atlanticum TaxID=357466 RepID=A0AAD4SI99_9MAGN|nr:hypothetical protein MKW98_012892 [Papaver atlanticum]